MDRKNRILIIDDEKDLVDAIKFQLEAKKCYEIAVAYNGIEGLKVLEKFEPDLIVLDINMPKMGGIEFYKNICDENSKTKYPVLVLTARANLERLFKDINVDGFMAKPFELEALLKEIETIIAKRSPEAQGGGLRSKARDVLEAKKKMLIVEDSKMAFDGMALTFLEADFTVDLAKSGSEAFNKILEKLPDIILIKLDLPDLAGDLVLSKLKQMPKTSDAVYVLYTAEKEPEKLYAINKVCEDLGVRNPVNSDDPETLLKEVKHALEECE